MNFLREIDIGIGAFILVLALFVIFLNGFTDAPNAISSVVGTGTLKMWQGCLLCAVFNFFGVILTSSMGMTVAKSVFSLANFLENREIGVIASLLSVIIFTVIAWLFSMPSSESHALISAIIGSSLAISSRLTSIEEILKILFYMIASFVVSFFVAFLIDLFFKKKSLPYGKLQIVGASLSSLMHGAQDGQKFVAVLMLLFISSDKTNDTSAHFSLVLIVSIAISLGALLGGGRIIKTFSEKTVSLNKKTGFISDISSSLSCFFFSLIGAPVSTSNIKALALMGTARGEGEKINKKTAKALILTTILTLPVCFALGYVIAKAIALTV